MAEDAIVFACANPVPEIWPWKAQAAGARIVATGRSDFANQVNNSLCFPGIFRGVLDVRARAITEEMAIAAAEALTGLAEEQGMNENHILPGMGEIEVAARVAAAVGVKAQDQGLAGMRLSAEELHGKATQTIRNVRQANELLLEQGVIPPAPA
jgi:malate dehydrogenase (oxaloacetate-decarboxylating)